MTKCPKCRATSGDDWSRCRGKCPMTMSPHFDQAIAEKFSRADPNRDALIITLRTLFNASPYGRAAHADAEEFADALFDAYEIKPKKRND